MGIKRVFCTNCGSEIQIDDTKTFCFCIECGTKIELIPSNYVKQSSEIVQSVEIGNVSVGNQISNEAERQSKLEKGLEEVAFYYQLCKDKKEAENTSEDPTYYLKAQDLLMTLVEQFPEDYRVWWEYSKPVDYFSDNIGFNSNYLINEQRFNKALDCANLEQKKKLIEAYDLYTNNSKKQIAMFHEEKGNQENEFLISVIPNLFEKYTKLQTLMSQLIIEEFRHEQICNKILNKNENKQSSTMDKIKKGTLAYFTMGASLVVENKKKKNETVKDNVELASNEERIRNLTDEINRTIKDSGINEIREKISREYWSFDVVKYGAQYIRNGQLNEKKITEVFENEMSKSVSNPNMAISCEMKDIIDISYNNLQVIDHPNVLECNGERLQENEVLGRVLESIHNSNVISLSTKEGILFDAFISVMTNG